MDWALFATILKVFVCLVALGVMAWLFSLLNEFLNTVFTVVGFVGGCCFLYWVFWSIHKMATKMGVVW